MAKRPAPPDLKSQLGSFLKTTLQQLDTVREVVVQKSRAGKIQFDITMLRRKRKAALARLGEVVVQLAGDGRLDEGEFPELSSALAEVDALDERIAGEERRARATAAGLPAEEVDVEGFHQAARRRAAAAGDGDSEEYDEDEDESIGAGAGGADAGAGDDGEAEDEGEDEDEK